jgi:MFS family permease
MPLPSAMLSPEQRWRRGLWLGVVAVALAAAAVFWPTGGSLLTPFQHPGETVSGLGHGTAATRLAWPLLVVAVIVLAQRLAPSIQGVARWIDNPGQRLRAARCKTPTGSSAG